MEIIYRLITYARRTERTLAAHPIPAPLIPKVKRIAGFRSDHDGLGDYALDAGQARKVGQLVGITVDPEAFDYFAEPYIRESTQVSAAGDSTRPRR
jgi:hypothetical protein